MFYVYLLKSKKSDKTYNGSTNNLRHRLKEHNKGNVTSTKRYKPWNLVYYEAYSEEKSARIREKRLKYNGNAIKELKRRVYPAPLLIQTHYDYKIFKKKHIIHIKS